VLRDERGRWLPGTLPPSNGRPKAEVHVRELARKYTEDAIRVLVEIALTGKKESARAAAAEALLDRAWGRPSQALEVSGDAGLRIVISERVAAALEAGRSGGSEGK
jgi:hypothetical protein